MKRVLVTGGAGFIGSHLVRALLDNGDQVVVFDNFSTGLRSNLEDIEQQITVIEADLADIEQIRAAVEGCELVFHQAALPSVPRSMQNPLETHQSNVTGTLNLLWASYQAGVRRVVSASSSSVYGDTPQLPKIESMELFPKSPYAASKLMVEIYSEVFTRAYQLETVCLRYFNVFGPRQDPDSPYAAVIPIWLRRMAQGLPPLIYGDGMQTRDFTYVGNVVAANLAAAQAPDQAVGRAFNVAAGECVVLKDLAQNLMDLFGFSGTIEYASPRQGDILHSWAGLDSISEAVGYQPQIDWHEGLNKTVAWFKNHTTP